MVVCAARCGKRITSIASRNRFPSASVMHDLITEGGIARVLAVVDALPIVVGMGLAAYGAEAEEFVVFQYDESNNRTVRAGEHGDPCLL